MNNSTHSSFSLPASDQDDFEVISVASTSFKETESGVNYHFTRASIPAAQPIQTPIPTTEALERYQTAYLSPEEVQAYIRNAIRTGNEPGDDCFKDTNVGSLGYRINEPPKMRPSRVLIFGAWDCLQAKDVLFLRQAKCAFQVVHLIAGVLPNKFTDVPADEESILDQVERAEVLRHVRYVDEVISLKDGEKIDEAFLKEWNVDYVAYEEGMAWSDEFEIAIRLGKLLPTRPAQTTPSKSPTTTNNNSGGTLRVKAPKSNDRTTPIPDSFKNRDTPEPIEGLDPFAP